IHENLRQLYSDLQREYDLVLDRRKVLTGQAQSLMSFAGIIETVLVGLVIALATNKDARELILNSSYTDYYLFFAGLGFVSYIITAIFSLLAFMEPKWTRVPQMPNKNPLDSIDHFFKNPDDIDLRMFARQLSDATSVHMKTNITKYTRL